MIKSLIGFGLISTRGRSYGCPCIQLRTPSEELARSTAVFEGRVISLTRYSREDRMVAGMDPVTMEFEARRAWKESDYETLYVNTAHDEGARGIGLR